VRRWRTGFYHIARGAEVPIILGFLDFERKVGGLGEVLWPTADLRADADRINAFYRDVKGKNPHLFTPIILAETTRDSRNEDPLADARGSALV
jgi:hypothetical protein